MSTALLLFLYEVYLFDFSNAFIDLHLAEATVLLNFWPLGCLRRAAVGRQEVLRSINPLRHHPRNIEAIAAVVRVLIFPVSRIHRVEALPVLIPLTQVLYV